MFGDGSLSYGYNASGTTQCINIGQNSNSNAINSTCIGHNTKSLNGFNVCIGTYANANALNMIAIGYNASNQSSGANVGCICIGSNSNIPYNTAFQNSTAIGINSQITASDQVQLGVGTSTVNCFNITPVNVIATNITTTNLTTTNLTTTNLTTSTTNTNLTIISYATLPLFITQKYVGYLQSTNSLKFYTSFNNFVNLSQISLSVGIWIVQYQISYNYSASNI